MNKENEIINLETHSISINQRQNIIIKGVTKIESFDSEEFLLETTEGSLGIKGRNLEIIKLDTYEGSITIKGIVDALSYLDTEKVRKEDGVLARLFK